MQIGALGAESLRGPHFALAEMKRGAALLVEEAEVNAEANAGKHKLAHGTGRIAYAFVDGEKILLEVEVGEADSGGCAVAELRHGG